ncbi:MAG: ABC transporter substrate-binding protein [Oscillospiraceae bacterium]|nr:ABC transporter substrate-binding protein [Oscillospiraceae bacterium]
MKKVLCLSLIFLLLAGCGIGDEKSSYQNNSITVYVGTNIFEESLDPVKGAMSYGYSFTNSALLKVAPNSEYVPDIAESFEVSKDALVYTFVLKSGILFSNGNAMTANDVVFTYQAAKKKQAENENIDLSKLDAVEGIDEFTVRFTLSEPYSPFLDTTALLGIVPASDYNSEEFDRYPIGSGAWKIMQYDPNQQIIVEPNEYYYGNTPKIGRISLVCMDNDTALSAARSGDLDLVMVDPAYALESIEGMTLHSLETMDIRIISMPVLPRQKKNNLTIGNNVTSDIAVRKALSVGIDRGEVIRHVYGGIGKAAVGFTDNLIWAEAVSVADGLKKEAMDILEAAGWADNGDGVREKEGIACSFKLYATAERYPLAAAIAQEAAGFGIEIVPHSSDWGEIAENMYTSGVIWGWGQYSPTVLHSLFSGEAALSDGWDNVAGYINPEVDGLINKALGATSQIAAIDSWKEAQALANADIPYIYIANIEHAYFVNVRLDISPETQIPHPHGHGTPVICNMADWVLR